jgi:hypothetical protein
MVTGSHPVPQPKWGYGVAQRHIHKQQLLREVIQQRLRGGLTGADLRQSPRPTTPPMGDEHVDVSRAELS